MGNAKRITRNVIVGAVFAGLALLASPGSADHPKAAAGICGALSDATLGLESLCVNYCEARDCPNSDKPECERLLTNYDRHRRDGDPEMPCLQTCPCFSAQELRDFPVELTQCMRNLSSDYLFTAIFGEFEADGAAASSRIDLGLYDCGYSVFSVDPPIIRFGGLALDPGEAAVCRAMIDVEIAERGLTCRPLY
jgi:hypothetical protein